MTTTEATLPDAPPGSGVAYRLYRGLDEVEGMAAANMRMRRHAGIIESVDVEGMQHRYTHLVNSDPLVDCVVVTRDEETAGYARVEWHDLNDGDRIYDATVVVEPASWGQGVADALVDWGERRLHEVAAAHPTDRRSWLASFAYGGDTELEAVLADRGYQAVRWDAEMLRPDLEAIPNVPAPDGYHLRTPEEHELQAVFEMAVAGFAEHWGQSEDDEQHIEEWLDNPKLRRDLLVVAWAGDEPAALVTPVLEPQPDGSIGGLLDGVVTHPGHRRRGLARACIAESLRRLRDAGATTAFLGVDTDNHNRAMALYESCGFRVVSSGTSFRKPLDGMEDTP